MLSLDLTHQAKNFLDQLDPKRFRQVARKIFSLMENPRPPDSRPLQGFPFLRADIGEYRIVYRIEGNCLKVALIDKRNDDEVYKKLSRI
ncbi:MAG: type II toxin-antitoxin system RelE/ParE family toxin [Candidatus Omnitrophica bacterium]|nr:type II toxin-antitoxin system RelE/ParE family toxin [Candidatus Omnitrophota bacterium]